MNSIIDNVLEISHVFHAPRAKLFEAWTKPEHIMHWWGPEGWNSPSAKNDFFVGGKGVYCMHGPAGTQWDNDTYSGFDYKEIEPGRKIVTVVYFCDSNGARVSPASMGMPADFPEEQNFTVLFEDVEEGASLLRIRYDLPTSAKERQAMLDSMIEQGWESSLRKLEGCLKTF